MAHHVLDGTLKPENCTTPGDVTALAARARHRERTLGPRGLLRPRGQAVDRRGGEPLHSSQQILDRCPAVCRHREPDELSFRLAHQQARSEEHTSELQSLMRISYAVFCLKKKKKRNKLS